MWPRGVGKTAKGKVVFVRKAVFGNAPKEEIETPLVSEKCKCVGDC